MEEKYQKIKEIVEKELASSTHGRIFNHVIRVYNLAFQLVEGENVDLDVLKAAVLLHDIARVKEDKDDSGNTDHAVLSSEMAVPILKKLGFPDDKIAHIKECILSHRYRQGMKPKTREAQILSDADNLDITGASGIARLFIYAGKYNQRIYSSTPLNEYIKDNLINGKADGRVKDVSKHAPNLEFKTKVKNLSEKIYTKKAKEIAKQRIKFMESFFERLKKEIDGEL